MSRLSWYRHFGQQMRLADRGGVRKDIVPRPAARRNLGGPGVWLVWLVFVVSGPATPAADDEPINLQAGLAFRQALEQPFGPSWDHIDLRMITRAITEGPRVAVLLDRRIDPTIERSPKLAGETLRDSLDRLAEDCGARATILGNLVYIGPSATTAKLRTLAALRKVELKDLKLAESRRSFLGRGRPLRWHDLDRPGEILQHLADEYRLSIDGVEQIPHDLWGAAAFPDVTPVEALTLVLGQFDLTFAWSNDAQRITLEPIPEQVAIEKPHDPPKGTTPAAALARWKESLPDLDGRVAGGKILVSGTEELHETLDRIRRGGPAQTNAKTTTGDHGSTTARLPPLSSKRYSGKIENKKVRDLMAFLETPAQGQIRFDYDPDELAAAGIDLDRLISLELKNDKIQDLLRKTFAGLGVEFELQDRTVKLKPARR
ncbi:MAG: STN domain-containing protein [Planctomycetes bacterium]|nr:STN domain-containing protein [Planctomycetota bacterium]